MFKDGGTRASGLSRKSNDAQLAQLVNKAQNFLPTFTLPLTSLNSVPTKTKAASSECEQLSTTIMLGHVIDSVRGSLVPRLFPSR